MHCRRLRRFASRAPSVVAALVAILCFGAGCATTSTVQSRRAERPASYASLSPAERALVDQGQIQVGMTEDAVYLAWGKPAQVLQVAGRGGESTTWLYTGVATDAYRYWTYREYPRRDGPPLVDRTLETDYDVNEFVSAEVVFEIGRVVSWRTLPRPPERTIYGPPAGY